jgi:hypothetical protein
VRESPSNVLLLPKPRLTPDESRRKRRPVDSEVQKSRELTAGRRNPEDRADWIEFSSQRLPFSQMASKTARSLIKRSAFFR